MKLGMIIGSTYSQCYRYEINPLQESDPANVSLGYSLTPTSREKPIILTHNTTHPFRLPYHSPTGICPAWSVMVNYSQNNISEKNPQVGGMSHSEFTPLSWSTSQNITRFIIISGRLQYKNWTNKQNHQNLYWEIMANQVGTNVVKNDSISY